MLLYAAAPSVRLNEEQDESTQSTETVSVQLVGRGRTAHQKLKGHIHSLFLSLLISPTPCCHLTPILCSFVSLLPLHHSPAFHPCCKKQQQQYVT